MTRRRGLKEMPSDWRVMPGWHREQRLAEGWAETWNRRGDGYLYRAFPYEGVTRNGLRTTSFRVCRRPSI